MKKKLIILLVILITLGLGLSIFLINKLNNKIDYIDLTLSKLKQLDTYSINIQISKMGNEIEDTTLNYSIEKENFTLSIYETKGDVTKNYFYQKYNNEYYLDAKEIKLEDFKYSNYEKYINILKYIEDIKLVDEEYKGKIKTNNLKNIINTKEDGITFIDIKDEIIQSISIVTDNYTINIDYKY